MAKDYCLTFGVRASEVAEFHALSRLLSRLLNPRNTTSTLLVLTVAARYPPDIWRSVG